MTDTLVCVLFPQAQWSSVLRFRLSVGCSVFLELVRLSRGEIFRRLLFGFLAAISLTVRSFPCEKLDECFQVLLERFIIFDPLSYLTLESRRLESGNE